MKQDVEGEHDEVEWRDCVFRKMYAWFVLTTALQVSKLRKYWCGVVLGKRTDTGTIDG
jgi:hypothetical protein